MTFAFSKGGESLFVSIFPAGSRHWDYRQLKMPASKKWWITTPSLQSIGMKKAEFMAKILNTVWEKQIGPVGVHVRNGLKILTKVKHWKNCKCCLVSQRLTWIQLKCS